jgi:hypothetical protein|tara:strand:- start:131 stop:382 length:252 start_codon:yes stop_codon:yes gene_type:complete
MMDKDYSTYIPQSFAASTLDVLNPNRSVIIDMIMVQILSMIVVMSMILVFKGSTMPSSTISYFLVGLFASFLMLSGVYSRITR